MFTIIKSNVIIIPTIYRNGVNLMENNKKDLKRWTVLTLLIIIAYWAINNLSIIGGWISNILHIIFPFLLGGCLAFVLNIPMTFFEKKILKGNNKKKNKKKNKKLVRIISIIFAILVIVLVVALIVTLILPKLIDIVNLLIGNIPYYTEQITKIFENYGANITDINTIIKNANIDMNEIKDKIIAQIPTLLTSSISIVSNIISGITTALIAIVFAIYILVDKEKLRSQITKILYAYLNKEKANKIINIGRVSKNIFKSFLTVQCLEATILGTLCVIGLLVFKIPYAVPIGVLIGVTALIPIVGAFIGIIIGSILILSVTPIKVVTFVIFVLVLQQIEGNLIYPRVVGNSIGLPGMWVLAAVSVGGSIGGILGMLLGVPTATIIYTLLRKNVYKRLEQKSED